MRSDAFIRVECDGGCRASLEIQLPAGARSTYLYSEDSVTRAVRREGWMVIGDRDLCPDCAERDDGYR